VTFYLETHKVTLSAHISYIRWVGSFLIEIRDMGVPLPMASLLREPPEVRLRDVVVMA
jgi:hypothetical protein